MMNLSQSFLLSVMNINFGTSYLYIIKASLFKGCLLKKPSVFKFLHGTYTLTFEEGLQKQNLHFSLIL